MCNRKLRLAFDFYSFKNMNCYYTCINDEKMKVQGFKGALDNILKFSFSAKFHLSCKIDWLFTNTKRKIQKFFLIVKKSSIFVKHAESVDEANMSCCCLEHGYYKPKCHNFQNVHLIFVSVQRTAQTSFRIFLKTRIMVAGAKLNSHDSGGHF